MWRLTVPSSIARIRSIHSASETPRSTRSRGRQKQPRLRLAVRPQLEPVAGLELPRLAVDGARAADMAVAEEIVDRPLVDVEIMVGQEGDRLQLRGEGEAAILLARGRAA